MSKIHLNIRTLTEEELSKLSSQDLILRNSKKMHGQILIMAGIVTMIVLIIKWDSLSQIGEFWNSLPIVTKILTGIILISFGTVFYSYFDKSVKLHINSKKIQTSNDIIKWEEIHEAFVNHQEYRKGRIELTLSTGTKRKLDISGLELRPNVIARELSSYWSAWKQMKNV